MVVDGGEGGRDDLGDLGVVHAGHDDVPGHGAPVLAQAGEGAVGDRVGGADDGVELGVVLEQRLGLLVAGVHGEVRDAQGALGHLEAGLGARGEKALAAHLAHGDVLLEDADVGGVTRVAQRDGGHLAHGLVVVLVDAGAEVDVLVEHHDGHGQGGDGIAVLGGDDGGDEDDAVHLALLGKEAQEVHLARGVVVCVGEKDLVSGLVQDEGDARDHPAHGGGVDLGDDDAHDVGLAGAQGLGLAGGDVAGLLDDAADGGALLLGDVAVVQVARDRRARDACHLGNLVDVHVNVNLLVHHEFSAWDAATRYHVRRRSPNEEGQSIAVPGKAGRVVAGVIVVAIIAIGVIMGFNPFGSNVPEGVDTDAAEVPSVTMSGEDYEVVDYNDVLYELSPDVCEVFVLDEGVTRQLISRDRNTLWITEDTAERIGVADAASE